MIWNDCLELREGCGRECENYGFDGMFFAGEEMEEIGEGFFEIQREIWEFLNLKEFNEEKIIQAKSSTIPILMSTRV